MEEHQEELATIESIDSGAVYTLALKTHVGMSIQTFRYFAGWCDKIQVSERRSNCFKSYKITVGQSCDVNKYIDIKKWCPLFSGQHHSHQPGQAQSEPDLHQEGANRVILHIKNKHANVLCRQKMIYTQELKWDKVMQHLS